MADAKITISADASAVERAAAAAKMAWRDAGTAMRDAIGSVARDISGQFARLAMETGKVNFSSQQQQVREFESATARLAVASGRDLESLRAQFEKVGTSIGKNPVAVAAWASEVGQLTYSFDGARESVTAMSALAAQTGRSFDSFKPLAVTLGQAGVAGKDTAGVIGTIAAQAERLGTVGGVAALTDQIQAAGSSFSMLADQGEQSVRKLSGLFAELGKGLRPEAAMRAQQGALGALTADPLGWERYLGKRITDDKGHVKDPTKALQEIVAKARRTYGSGDQLRRVLQQNFGMETGAALFKAGFKSASFADLKPSVAPARAQEKLRNTDAGKRDVADALLAQSSREMLGSSTKLGQAADALQKFAANSPVLSTIGTTFAGTALSNFLSRFDRSTAGNFSAGTVQRVMGIAKMSPLDGLKAAASGSTAALAGMGRGLLSVTAALAPLAAGAAVAYAGVRGIKAAEAAAEERHRLEERARDAESDGGRKLKSVAIQRTNKAMHQLDGLSQRDRAAAINATSRAMVSHDPNAALSISRGGDFAVKAIASQLANSGRSNEEIDRLARAVAAAIKQVNMQVNVINSTGGPIEASMKGAQSAGAGVQSGG